MPQLEDAQLEPPGEPRRLRLLRDLRDQRWFLIGGVVLLSTWQAGEAMVPVTVGEVLDHAVRTGSTSSLVAGIAILAAVFLTLSWSYRLASRLLTRAAEHYAHAQRLRIVDRALHPHGTSGTDATPGHVLSLTTADTSTVAMSAWAFAELFAGGTAMVVATVMLLRISVGLGLVVVVGIPLLLGVLTLAARPIERRTTTMFGHWAAAVGVATDMAAGVHVLKGLGAERSAAARYQSASQRSRHATVDAGWAIGAQAGMTEALTGAFLALVAGVGGHLALTGNASVGELVSAVGLTAFMVGPFRMLADAFGALAEARAADRRIHELLDAPTSVTDGRAAPASDDSASDDSASDDGVLALELVGVGKGPLRGVSMRVDTGQIVAVAADVAEARQLVELIRRDVDPDSGTISIGGHDLRDLPVDDLRRTVHVAGHGDVLFEGSLHANVAVIAANELTHRDAVVASTTDEVIRALPDGADTDVGPRGQVLSGGQRQRVALARALASDADVLVLHDPTTAVDAVTESNAAEGIASMRKGKATLIVTTSPELLAIADAVVVLTNGTVTATGSHAELLLSNETYRGLVGL